MLISLQWFGIVLGIGLILGLICELQATKSEQGAGMIGFLIITAIIEIILWIGNLLYSIFA